MMKIVNAVEFLASIGFKTRVVRNGYEFNIWLPVETIAVYDEPIFHVEGEHDVNTVGEGVSIYGLCSSYKGGSKISVTTFDCTDVDLVYTILHEEVHAASHIYNSGIYSLLSTEEDEAVADTVATVLMKAKKFDERAVVCYPTALHMISCDTFSSLVICEAKIILQQMLTGNTSSLDLKRMMGCDEAEELEGICNTQVLKAIASIIPKDLFDAPLVSVSDEEKGWLLDLADEAISSSDWVETFHKREDNDLCLKYIERLNKENEETRLLIEEISAA